MSEIWIAALGTVAGGVLSAQGAKDAAGESAAGSAAAIEEQRRQFNTVRGDTAPYRAIGSQAINRLGQLYGFSPAATPLSFDQWVGQNPSAGMPSGGGGDTRSDLLRISDPLGIAGGSSTAERIVDPLGIFGGSKKKKPVDPMVARQSAYQTYLQNFDYMGSSPKSPPQNGVDPSSGMMIGPGGSITQGAAAGSPAAGVPDYGGFFASPDFQFNRDQQLQAVERSAAARGGLVSGNTGAAIEDHASGLASREYSNFFNRLASLSGIGQTGVNTATTAGMNTANNVSGALTDAGNARASGVSGQADAWGNALGQIGGIVYDRWGRPKKTGT